MANDAATLRGYLATALRDTAYATWTSGEMDNLISWAVDSLYPRYARPLDPSATGSKITVVADTYYYALPTGALHVSRVDRLDSSGNDYGPIDGRAWELTGDLRAGTGKLHIGRIANAGDKLACHGFGVYDLVTNQIPNELIPLVTAKARAEAYRRMAANREQFKAWLARNQTQNVSVGEALAIINEADAEIQRLERAIPRTWMGPVSAKVG